MGNERARNDFMEIVLRHFSFSKVLLCGLALLLWMAVIFFFSSLPGSGNQYELTILYYIERKGAHVIEYAVLMFLSVRFLRALFPMQSFTKILFWAAIFSLLYGISDELHQSFVPYRGAKMSDVLIDGIGISLSGLLIFFVSHIRRK